MPPRSAATSLSRALVVVLALCAGLVGLSAAPSGAQAPPVAASPAAFTLEPGDSQVVEFRLSEPIIAGPGEPDPAFVTLTLTPGGAGSLELSATSVSWLSTGWHEPRSVTFTALDDAADPSGTVEVAGAVTSNSDFYDGRVLALAVEVVPGQAGTTTTLPGRTAAPPAPPATVVGAPEPTSGRALAAAAASPTPGVSDASLPTELALTGPPGVGALAVVGLLLVAVGAALAGRRRR